LLREERKHLPSLKYKYPSHYSGIRERTSTDAIKTVIVIYLHVLKNTNDVPHMLK